MAPTNILSAEVEFRKMSHLKPLIILALLLLAFLLVLLRTEKCFRQRHEHWYSANRAYQSSQDKHATFLARETIAKEHYEALCSDVCLKPVSDLQLHSTQLLGELYHWTHQKHQLLKEAGIQDYSDHYYGFAPYLKENHLPATPSELIHCSEDKTFLNFLIDSLITVRTPAIQAINCDQEGYQLAFSGSMHTLDSWIQILSKSKIPLTLECIRITDTPPPSNSTSATAEAPPANIYIKLKKQSFFSNLQSGSQRYIADIRCAPQAETLPLAPSLNCSEITNTPQDTSLSPPTEPKFNSAAYRLSFKGYYEVQKAGASSLQFLLLDKESNKLLKAFLGEHLPLQAFRVVSFQPASKTAPDGALSSPEPRSSVLILWDDRLEREVELTL